MLFWFNKSERVKSNLINRSCKLSSSTNMISKPIPINNIHAKFNNEGQMHKFMNEIQITTSNIYHEWQCRVCKDLVPVGYLCRSLSNQEKQKIIRVKKKTLSSTMKHRRIHRTKCILCLVPHYLLKVLVYTTPL